MSSSREEFVAALRETADWFEAHPDAPLPSNYFGIKLAARVETVAELRAAFHLSGPWEKEYLNETATYTKLFGPQPENKYNAGNHIIYTLSLPREEVCVKRQVGERYVPGYAPPVYSTPGRMEPVYEWDCM